MIVLIFNNIVASLTLISPVNPIMLADMHVVETDDSPIRRKRGQFIKEESEIDWNIAIWVTKNASDFELIVDQFWFILESFKNSAYVDFFRVTSFVVDWFTTITDNLLKEVPWFHPLYLAHSHHLARMETLNNFGSEKNTLE